MNEQKLSVWHNSSNDWVIAYSAEDAAKVFEEVTGESWADYADGEEWVPDDRDEWEILQEDDPSMYNQPDGAIIGKTERGYWYVRASQEAWIKHQGRHFLCGMDW